MELVTPAGLPPPAAAQCHLHAIAVGTAARLMPGTASRIAVWAALAIQDFFMDVKSTYR
jgi:hypothetical protein